jgi:hypothetical protein
MKKLIAIAVAVLCFAAAASAQSRSLGVRITYGAEVSYQHGFGDDFLEADLGWFNHGFYVTGIYDFVFASEGNFNFYAGPGAGIGFYDYEEDNGIEFAVAGQLGMEYNFNLPLTLSLDWRPAYYFQYNGFDWHGIALGIRYRF